MTTFPTSKLILDPCFGRISLVHTYGKICLLFEVTNNFSITHETGDAAMSFDYYILSDGLNVHCFFLIEAYICQNNGLILTFFYLSLPCLFTYMMILS